MISLSDKTILLTGGLGAIAEHMLKAFSKAGATLVVTDQAGLVLGVVQIHD